MVQSLSFSISAFLYTLFKKSDVIYSRDELPLFFISFFKRNIFWEAHMPRWNFITRYVSKKCDGTIVITQGLKNFYLENKVDSEKIIVAPDGVDIEKFNISISKKESRKKLRLPLDKKLIVYTGHLYDWKGAQVLADASKFFDNKSLVIFDGGT